MIVGIDCTPLQIRGGRHGVGSYLRGLIGALARATPGCAYALFAYPGGDLGLGPLPAAFRVVRLPAPPLGRARALLSHQLLLPALARRLGVGVLHVPSVSTNASLPAIPLIMPVPVVVTVQDLIPMRFPAAILPGRRHRLFYRAMLAAVRRAAHVLCTSASTRDAVVGELGVAPARVSVVPLAPDPLFSAAPAPAEDARAAALSDRHYVLHVGGAQPMKNLVRLAGAMARLWAAGTAADLVCVAPSAADVLRLVPEADRARVVALADVSPAFLRWLYQHAQALAVPSLHEGFGLPALEAMACGCPVVAARAGALPEVAGDAAVYVEPSDVADIAAGVGRVLGDAALAGALRARGLARAAEFGYDRTARATLEVYARAGAR